MADYGVSLGVPNAATVEKVGDRKYSNKEQHQKDKKKQEEKKSLITKPDEVIISKQAPTEAKGQAEVNEAERESPPKGKGDIIDIKA